MNPTSCLILQKLLETYRPEEFPALLHQCESWAKTQPLNSLHILDAPPSLPTPAPNMQPSSPLAPHSPFVYPLVSHQGYLMIKPSSPCSNNGASLQLTLYTTRLNPLMTSSASTGSSDKKWTYSGSFNQIH
ncbi:MAG: hypothetical protein RSA21_01090 [Akkermansia sp.]